MFSQARPSITLRHAAVLLGARLPAHTAVCSVLATMPPGLASSFVSLPTRRLCQVDNNVSKGAQLLDVIAANVVGGRGRWLLLRQSGCRGCCCGKAGAGGGAAAGRVPVHQLGGRLLVGCFIVCAALQHHAGCSGGAVWTVHREPAELRSWRNLCNSTLLPISCLHSLRPRTGRVQEQLRLPGVAPRL